MDNSFTHNYHNQRNEQHLILPNTPNTYVLHVRHEEHNDFSSAETLPTRHNASDMSSKPSGRVKLVLLSQRFQGMTNPTRSLRRERLDLVSDVVKNGEDVFLSPPPSQQIVVRIFLGYFSAPGESMMPKEKEKR